LEVAVDLRGLFGDGGEMLRWTYEHLWPRFEKNLLCVYPPVAEAYELRDYIITNKIFTLWIPSFQDRSNRGARPREELEVVERMLSEAPISIPVIGRLGDGRILGHTPENGLAFLSQFGKYFVPLDVAPRSVPPVGLSNLSVLSALPEKTAAGERRARRELEVERDKIYIAVLNRPLDPASLLATSPSAGETTQLPGDVALAESLEPGALLDLAPGLVQRLLRGGGKPRAIDGASGPGLVHFGRLGDRYGDARQAVSRAYFAELASFQRRHGLRFVTQTSSGRFRQDMESSGLADLMPETAIFVSYSAEETVNPLTATYRLGKAVVFHDVGPAVLGSYFSGTAGAAVYKRFLPAFLATTATSLSLDIADGKELPDDIVFVSFEELVELYRRWSERRRLVSFEFVRQGAAWKYHDGGEDLGRAWRQPSYNDSRWSTGKSELGYGDSSSPKPEATVISWGSNASSKHPCYYFRRTFEYDPSSPARFLLLEVIRDDGCVVYLNGKEVLRDNLPEGEIAHDTMAQRTIGSAEEYTWVPATIDGSLLRRGKNTVAVEMHQATPNSSDLSFDLRLSGYRHDVAGENR
ncbi:MAG: GxGYxYP family putative glycoside hydrolase, partial [Planctomycetota bacterium]|nr:GxGYxYP family putative glycoside hydrolase [Planctomycetota bacterium]